MITVFDRARIRQARARRVRGKADPYFLFDWSIKHLAERLSLVRKDFPLCVRIGARGPSLPNLEKEIIVDSAPLSSDVICEEDFWPFAQNSIDLVVSALNLHTVNDLPGALLQINRSLKPDGLFMATILGGETLRELRECLNNAELELSGGGSPRVAPFADMPQMAGLLQRAGFALPVVDSEILTVTYENIFALMQDLRAMGETNFVTARSKKMTSRALFARAGQLYAQRHADPDGRIRATFEIIFLLGWAPHDSQQKPLRPGSAQTRLAEHLGTIEIGTGERPQ